MAIRWAAVLSAPLVAGTSPCCFGKWGGAEQCGLYPKGADGGRCQGAWDKKCQYDGQCAHVPSGRRRAALKCPKSLADPLNATSGASRRRAPTPVDGKCQSAKTPGHSCCTGCPPMHNGKLCASTSLFHDQTKGPCGCGEEPPPLDHWNLRNLTAALNAKSLDHANPFSTWCPSGCGGCYELCSTGGYTDGLPINVKADTCRVFKVSNRCGDGYDPTHIYPEWCSNKMTWKQCQKDPAKCQSETGSTNKFGYPAHFDLMNLAGQIEDLGWAATRVEVTFEPVSCDRFDGPKWDCECPAHPSAESDAVALSELQV